MMVPSIPVAAATIEQTQNRCGKYLLTDISASGFQHENREKLIHQEIEERLWGYLLG